MKLHFLDARGELTELRSWLRDRLVDAYTKACELLPLLPIDVVVKAGKFVIPEKGHVGYAPDPGKVFVTVDPDNPALMTNSNSSLERMLVHELHHSARWDGPGYGSSLGEALVSEGLAGHFVQEVYGGPAEPWESVEIDKIRAHIARAARDWEASDYDHKAWFYGTGELPRWVGYSLGFQLVANFLDMHSDQRASGLVHADAQAFRGCLKEIQQAQG